MARQHYDRKRNHFFLDLHGVLKRDAARVIRKRIEECRGYGIASLEVVYGTPDFFDGSIASALHHAVSNSPDIQTSFLPRGFLDDCEQFAARVPKITIALRAEGVRGGESMIFTPFPASREPDPWLRRLCENPFSPCKRSFSQEEAAQFVGRGCRPADFDKEFLTPEELEEFCRSWQPPDVRSPTAPAAEPTPDVTPEPVRETSPEEHWSRAWSEAAEAFMGGDAKRSQILLQECMTLAGESADARFLARTLGALAILHDSREDPAKAQAYYDSASAAFEQFAGDATSERVELESVIVDRMLQQGRLADAASLLRNMRERLTHQDGDYAPGLVYTLTTEAALRSQLDDLEAASELLVQAVNTMEASSRFPPVTLAHARLQLGLLESRRGLLRKALAHLTQAAEELDLDPRCFAQGFLCRREIAAVAGQLGYGKQAQELLERLVKVRTAPGSPADLLRIAALMDIGNLYIYYQRWSDAETICVRARDEIVPAGSPPGYLFDIHQNLGSVYTHTGRFAEAEREFNAAFEIGGRMFPSSHPSIAQLHRNTGVLFTHAGRYKEARSSNEKALRIYEDCGGPAVPDLAEAHFSQGMLLAIAAEWDECEYHLRLALSLKNRIFGEGHPATVLTLLKLGHVLHERGLFLQARPMLTRAMRIAEDHRMEPEMLWEGYTYLAQLQASTGQHKEAGKSKDKADWYGWAVREKRKK